MPVWGRMTAAGADIGLPGSTPGDFAVADKQFDRQHQLKMQGNQFAFQGDQAGKDRAFQGGQNDLQRQLSQWTTGQEQSGQTERAHIAADAQTLPAWLAQGRFNQVFPWVQQQMGQLGKGGAPGQGGQGPAIGAGPVWTNQQIQQRVNAQTAQNDQATGSQVNQMQQSLAGRGFGAGSPLEAALGAQFQMGNMANNAQAAQSTYWNAAQGNAQQRLQGQVAQSQAFGQRQQEGIQRQQIAAGQQNALIAALGGMV